MTETKTAPKTDEEIEQALQKTDITLYTDFKGINAQKMAVLRKTICKGFDFYEACHFLSHCAAIGLNPFNKEVWGWKDNKGRLQTMIGEAGYRVNASKHKEFKGVYEGDVHENDVFEIDRVNGIVKHTHGKEGERGALVGAWAQVIHGDWSKPIVTYASLKEYFQKTQYDNGVWDKNPTKMILKVARSQALALAFPVSGTVPEWEIETKNGVTDYVDHTKTEESEEEIAADELSNKIAEALELWELYEGEDKVRIGETIRNLIANKTITIDTLEDYIDAMSTKK